jgi:hypothetical protein
LISLHVLFVVDVDGRPYLSASTTLVRLLLNILIHSYRLHCDKQFCPYLQPIVDGSLPLSSLQTHTHTKRTIIGSLSLVQTSSGAVIFTPCSRGTVGLQLNHTRNMPPL